MVFSRVFSVHNVEKTLEANAEQNIKLMSKV